jgi:hypothetical protein
MKHHPYISSLGMIKATLIAATGERLGVIEIIPSVCSFFVLYSRKFIPF